MNPAAMNDFLHRLCVFEVQNAENQKPTESWMVVSNASMERPAGAFVRTKTAPLV
jgi:hypothetical protein